MDGLTLEAVTSAFVAQVPALPGPRRRLPGAGSTASAPALPPDRMLALVADPGSPG
jgi:hypothetical protein